MYRFFEYMHALVIGTFKLQLRLIYVTNIIETILFYLSFDIIHRQTCRENIFLHYLEIFFFFFGRGGDSFIWLRNWNPLHHRSGYIKLLKSVRQRVSSNVC